jgi:hypothetical protein
VIPIAVVRIGAVPGNSCSGWFGMTEQMPGLGRICLPHLPRLSGIGLGVNRDRHLRGHSRERWMAARPAIRHQPRLAELPCNASAEAGSCAPGQDHGWPPIRAPWLPACAACARPPSAESYSPPWAGGPSGRSDSIRVRTHDRRWPAPSRPWNRPCTLLSGAEPVARTRARRAAIGAIRSTDSAHRAERPIIPAHRECAPYRERCSGPRPDRHSTCRAADRRPTPHNHGNCSSSAAMACAVVSMGSTTGSGVGSGVLGAALRRARQFRA